MADVSHDWLERNFPCKEACPVHTEAGKYVTLISQGKYREAYAVARRPNPLASICGRICAAPCETVCRRGELDAPIAIRALKRFVTERFGVESMMDFSVLSAIYGHRPDHYPERVAVVGSGPAGLACAHDLALMGYPVTIFEAAPVAGGMLRLGVPEYRLPRALIQLEVNAILSLGVELKTGVRLGRDFTLSDLRAQGFSAIFLGVGAMQSRDLSIPGMELDGVLKGIDYLLNVNLGYKVEMGARVVVIGGGNVALDVARTAARSGVEENLERNLSVVQALDVARSAVRFGAREVVVCCLESESEMPAAKEEVEEARREGIRFRYRARAEAPRREGRRPSRAWSFSTSRASSTRRGASRPGSWRARRASSRPTPSSSRSGRPGTFPSSARRTGSRRAEGGSRSIRKRSRRAPRGSTRGVTPRSGPASRSTPSRTESAAPSRSTRSSGAGRARRPRSRSRSTCTIATKGTSTTRASRARRRRPAPSRAASASPRSRSASRSAQAQLEGTRCLHCWTNTIFEESPAEGTECILCGGCQDICPEDCIEILLAERVTRLPAAARELAPILADGARGGSVFIKDEETCIRCGLCAARCPVGTITMQSFHTPEGAHV